MNYSAHSLHSIRLTQRGTEMIATSPSCHVIEMGTQHTKWSNGLEVGTFVPDTGLLKVSAVPNLLSEGGRQSAH